MAAARMVDVDAVLRHFGSKRKLAREHYREFIEAGMRAGHRDEFYLAENVMMLPGESYMPIVSCSSR